MVAVVFWIVLCFVVAYVATQRGRSGVGFFFLAFFLSPLVGFLVAIALPKRGEAAAVPSASGFVLCSQCGRPNRDDAQLCKHCGGIVRAPAPAMKTCAMCAETIRAEAIRCRYCGADQPQPAPAAVVAAAPVGMNRCPSCGKLRHPGVPECVYCGSAEPLSAAR